LLKQAQQVRHFPFLRDLPICDAEDDRLPHGDAPPSGGDSEERPLVSGCPAHATHQLLTDGERLLQGDLHVRKGGQEGAADALESIPSMRLA
jgi:hypothetical protein